MRRRIFYLGLTLFMVPLCFAFSQKRSTIKDFDPFNEAPTGSRSGCQAEHRFKYDVMIQSVDQFILFLKNHQSSQDIHGFIPHETLFVPGFALDSAGNDPRKRINLDRLKSKVYVIEPKTSKVSNRQVYVLRISHEDYDETCPWEVVIKVSNQGYVSVVSCLGI